MEGLQRPPKFPAVSSLAWLGRRFFEQKCFSPPQISPAGLLMNVTFILLGSSLFLRSVLRLIIFHNLKNISLVDHISKNETETERERERAQTKQIEKKGGLTFT